LHFAKHRQTPRCCFPAAQRTPQRHTAAAGKATAFCKSLPAILPRRRQKRVAPSPLLPLHFCAFKTRIFQKKSNYKPIIED
jgi:hypothetical protein